MAEKSSFFDSVNADRVYYAADMASHMAEYFTNGIFNNGLRVVANNDMSVSVQLGAANINGYKYKLDTNPKVINVANADGILNRVDNIVIRLDIPNRQITSEIITGDFAEEAVAPTLSRGTSIYDLRIAKISVPAGTVAITEDLIEDTRFNNEDCGNVVCAVQNPDFTNVLSQYMALWNNLIGKQAEDFKIWFDEMKNQLSEDAAGNLQLKIDEMQKNIVLKLSELEYKKYIVTLNETITQNINYQIPATYIVDSNNLEILWNGIELIKDENYIEVGNKEESSNIIQFKDWDVDTGDTLVFKIKGSSIKIYTVEEARTKIEAEYVEEGFYARYEGYDLENNYIFTIHNSSTTALVTSYIVDRFTLAVERR